MSHELSTERTALSDRAVSYLRTVVPALWGAVVAVILKALAPHLPAALYDELRDLLSGPLAQALVVSLAVAAWYWLWRRIEHRIPDWLTRVVLGSARTPGYGLPVIDSELTPDGAAVITSLSVTERTSLQYLRAALADTSGPDDPAVAAIDRVLHGSS